MKKAIIIGAGPAGLTAAYELLTRTDIIPIVLEKSGDIGGISKTVNYKGNRIDIGGHRFFSKSDRVMEWWINMMPIAGDTPDTFTINYQNKSRTVTNTVQEEAPSANTDKVMLVRQRLSRIYFLRKFFTYPIQLSFDTLKKLGIGRTLDILYSYVLAQIFPRQPEKNLEDFMINRFGETLYHLFFKDYTEKVWGIPCNKISAEWGAQRIKGVSISKAIQHAVQAATKPKHKNEDLSQKGTETSLIEQFLYPKFGPGQLWEEVARQVQEMGGVILKHHDVTKVYSLDTDHNITAIAATNNITEEVTYLEGDYFFSTMPVKELIAAMEPDVPEEIKEIAAGLLYRDFITVGILLKQLSCQDKTTGAWQPMTLKDTWIYIQEKDVTVGRLQLFNNWSPYMVKDPENVWIGMEFFCNTTDSFWQLPDNEICQLAIQELEKIGLAAAADVLDSTVIRMEKTYPAYFGSYENFDLIRAYTDRFENLFLVGRNGMHKYNNSDHSMLTAMVAVDNIAAGITSKANLWSINTEQEYHEEKETASAPENTPAAITNGYRNLKDYIFRHPAHKWYAWAGILLIILQFSVFKFFYPFASYINGDSYIYLVGAYLNLDINTYPIGYSRFLRFFSVFSTSDTVLVTFQYFLLMASIMALLFTLFYFYNPSKLLKLSLFVLMLINPVFPYLANYVSSDCLFLSVSLIWFTQLIWIIYRPGLKLILINALLLFFAFTIRYNALYYPLIAFLAFMLTKPWRWVKLGGLALSLLLISNFITFTSSNYGDLVGKRQFSPFTGWQMANNAMYAYRHIPKQAVKKTPAMFKNLDQITRTYFDKTSNELLDPKEASEISTVYMWTPSAPLQKYMEQKFEKDTLSEKLKKWATMAPFYKDYGQYLISTYPNAFVHYYLWPNVINFFTPPVEFLGKYSTGVDTVKPIAKVWFGYESNKLKTRTASYKVPMLAIFPNFIGVLHLIFLTSFAGFLFLFGFRTQNKLMKVLLLVAVLYIINFAFSVFSAPIALRLQLFPIIICMCFAFLLVEQLAKSSLEK